MAICIWQYFYHPIFGSIKSFWQVRYWLRIFFVVTHIVTYTEKSGLVKFDKKQKKKATANSASERY